MAQESPSRDQDKFMVRMPEGMRERIAEAAKANNRSMNAEIVARLASSLDRTREPLSDETIRFFADAIGSFVKKAVDNKLTSEQINVVLEAARDKIPKETQDDPENDA